MDPKSLSFIALVVNSALYLVLIFLAGIFWENRWAAILSIATAGVCYLAYSAELVPAPDWALRLCMGMSIFLGAAAGIALLFGSMLK